jgi:hypothetical protein
MRASRFILCGLALALAVAAFALRASTRAGTVEADVASAEPSTSAIARPQPPAPSLAAAPSKPAERREVIPPAPRAEREAALLAKLRASGRVNAAWTQTARDVIAKWRAPDGVTFGAFECHADGCIVTATYRDELVFELADESLTETDAFKAYPGWRHRSFARDAAGQVVATWFFMNPSRTAATN